MRYVYAVIGHTGEYSDHTQWLVAVYPEREVAEQHARMAQEQVNEKEKEFDDWLEGYKQRREFMGSFHLDVGLELNYGKAKYEVQEVPLVSHVDEYQDRLEELRGKR